MAESIEKAGVGKQQLGKGGVARDDTEEERARGNGVTGKQQKKQKRDRDIDWSEATFGHFVMKLSYVGTNYHGNAWQDPSICTTVENAIFEALVKTRLIKDRASCGFSRCGRTDKGVHAAGNYISLQVRLKRQGKADVVGGAESVDDYDYASVLNGVLPSDIRILASARAPPAEFDARFSCSWRHYRYYFPRDGEDLERMHKAAQRFIGEHDFRNFCKMDIEHVATFRRCVLSCRVIVHSEFVGEVAVAGSAFLWHQVRNMVAILLLIGQGFEDASIIDELLDIERHPRKPIYEPADESGLVLWDCGFEGLPFSPGKCFEETAASTPLTSSRTSTDGADRTTASEEVIPTRSAVVAPEKSASSSVAKSFMQMRSQSERLAAVYSCLACSAQEASVAMDRCSGVAQGRAPQGKSRGYTPILFRGVGPSLEEKLGAFEIKKKRKEGEVCRDEEQMGEE